MGTVGKVIFLDEVEDERLHRSPLLPLRSSTLPRRPALPGGGRFTAGWRVAAGGLVGLAVFWLLVVLPVVATDRGFVLTAALASLGGALWIAPRRSS